MPKLTPKNKFAISRQYLKKQVSDEVDFLHADNNESFLQIDIMFLLGIVKHSQSFKNSKSAMSLQYLQKKKLEMKLIFLHADKHQSLPLVKFNTLGIKSFIQGDTIIIEGTIEHSESR